MHETVFVVQPYVARGRGLVPQPARVVANAAEACRLGRSLARFRAGVVVLSQSVDPLSAWRGAPKALAVYGRVPDGWKPLDEAA